MNALKILALFFEGILSFFSPCVLPILPIYIGILGGQGELDANGQLVTNRRRIVTNTLFFVLGITLTFFVLAFASSLISRSLNQHMELIQTLGGLLIILMGLLQLGVFRFALANREFSAKNKIYQAGKQVTPILAVLMGFTFSFSWSPCIGPILASVFLYASSHQGLFSIFLISVYCLGFILPFIAVAIFSQQVLTFFKSKYHLLKYTKIISGFLLLVIGLSILTGSFSAFSHLFY